MNIAILGVCYHSATVLAPGRVLHAGQGRAMIGLIKGLEATFSRPA